MGKLLLDSMDVAGLKTKLIGFLVFVLVFAVLGFGLYAGYQKIVALKEAVKTAEQANVVLSERIGELTKVNESLVREIELAQKSEQINDDVGKQLAQEEKHIEQQSAKRQQKVITRVETIKQDPSLALEEKKLQISEALIDAIWVTYCSTRTGQGDPDCVNGPVSLQQELEEDSPERLALAEASDALLTDNQKE